ncbi:MAG: tRNA (adenosine(37)-N6)-threonylcarbamoyltransferase complex dimerization subunit type 1 TsaB [Chitinophagaceae bacterium]
MGVILNIDTALEQASVSIASEGNILFSLETQSQKDQASWLHPAIQTCCEQAGVSLTEIDAVAVSIGPGSYTGLRVGLSTAKGICYATGCKLIGVSTLQILASTAVNEDCDLICPMIDARRMEVYTAVYEKTLNPVKKPFAIILNHNSFSAELKENKVLFLGSGAQKFQELCKSPHAIFKQVQIRPYSMAQLSENCFVDNNFVDIAYSEPLYLKDFYSGQSQS